MGGTRMVPENDLQDYDAFLHGDIGSFEHLVIAYRDQLVSFLYRYTNDIYLAQDLAQDAFVEILVHKERFRKEMNFKTYLFTIGRNKAVDYIRKNGKYIFEEDTAKYLEPVKGLEDAVIENEEKKLLYQKIYELKTEYQAVILLVDFEEMTYQEAACVMGKSLSQIKVLLHRARKALAREMRKEGGQE